MAAPPLEEQPERWRCRVAWDASSPLIGVPTLGQAELAQRLGWAQPTRAQAEQPDRPAPIPVLAHEGRRGIREINFLYGRENPVAMQDAEAQAREAETAARLKAVMRKGLPDTAFD